MPISSKAARISITKYRLAALLYFWSIWAILISFQILMFMVFRYFDVLRLVLFVLEKSYNVFISEVYIPSLISGLHSWILHFMLMSIYFVLLVLLFLSISAFLPNSSLYSRLWLKIFHLPLHILLHYYLILTTDLIAIWRITEILP